MPHAWSGMESRIKCDKLKRWDLLKEAFSLLVSNFERCQETFLKGQVKVKIRCGFVAEQGGLPYWAREAGRKSHWTVTGSWVSQTDPSERRDLGGRQRGSYHGPQDEKPDRCRCVMG